MVKSPIGTLLSSWMGLYADGLGHKSGWIKSRSDDINFKLELCNNLGFFRNYIDDENYILIYKKFGPKKFVEAFTWRLFKKKEINRRFTENELKNSKNLTQQYNRDIHPVERSSSYYSFEFAKIQQEESE